MVAGMRYSSPSAIFLIVPRTVALILSGSPTAQKRIVKGFDPPLRARLEALGATVESVDFVPLEDEQGEVELAEVLLQRSGTDLIVLPRLLASDKLTHEDIYSLGHGGLLDEILERGLPRGKISNQ